MRCIRVNLYIDTDVPPVQAKASVTPSITATACPCPSRRRLVHMYCSYSTQATDKFTQAPAFLFHDCLRKPDFTQAKTALHTKYNIVRPLGRLASQLRCSNTHDFYHSGACGEVWLATEKQTGRRFAAKVIQKRRFNSSGVRYCNRCALKHHSRIFQVPAPSTRELIIEVNILQQLNHVRFVHCGVHADACQCSPMSSQCMRCSTVTRRSTLCSSCECSTSDIIYEPKWPLSSANGGELFDRIIDKHRFTEEETKFFFHQLFTAVKYLHSNGVVHRDLKVLLPMSNKNTCSRVPQPENILLADGTMDAVVKVTDFGLAKLVGPQSFMKTMCGTPDYLAPEVLKTGMLKNSAEQVHQSISMASVTQRYGRQDTARQWTCGASASFSTSGACTVRP